MKRTSVGEDHRDPFKFTHEVICLRTFQPMADFLSFAFCFLNAMPFSLRPIGLGVLG